MSFTFLNQLPSPAEIKRDFPLSEELKQLKKERDAMISDVITRNDDQTVGNILLDFCEAADIITDSVLTVCGTRSDDNEKTVIFSGDNVGDHSIPFFF